MTRTQLSSLLRQAIIVAIYFTLFTTPFLWTAKTSELFELPKMMFVYAMAAVVGGLYLARMVSLGKIYYQKSPFNLILLLFLASQILSTLFSIDPHTSLFGYYSRFHGGLLSTLAYLTLFFATTAHFTAKNVRQTIVVILLSATLTSLYSFPEHFGHSPSCKLVTGNFDVACWIQDVQTRVYGTFGQPNWQAAYIISVIFLAMAMLVTSYKLQVTRINKYILVACYLFLVALLFSVLLFTKSRSGLLGFVIGMLSFTGLTAITMRHQLKKFSLWLITCSLLLVTCYLLFGRGVLPQTDSLIFNRPTPPAVPTTEIQEPTTTSGTQLEIGGTESAEIRAIVWQGALDLFKKYPLFGSGTETFAYGYYNVRPTEHNLVSEWDFLYNKAHNEFLNFLATTGLTGFLTYMGIIVIYAIWSTKQVLIIRSSLSMYHVSFLSGFLALSVSNFFGFSTVSVALLFFLFPALAYSLTKPEIAKTRPNKKTSLFPVSYSLTLTNWIALGVISILTLYTLYQVAKLYTADIAYARGKALNSQNRIQEALPLLNRANMARPKEPVYTDEISLALAKTATALTQTQESTQAATIAALAIRYSDETIKLNPVHLNFWKSRARVFAALYTLDPTYVTQARHALEEAIKLAPTDAKLYYNLALMHTQIGQVDKAFELLEYTIHLKPNYESARQDLAQIHEDRGNPDKALDHYQYILEKINPNNEQAASRSASLL